MLNMRLSSAIYPSRNAHVQLIVGGMYTPLLHGQNSSFLTVGSLYIMAPKFNHGRNSKIMVFQLMLVAVVAFLLGFVSLYSFRRKKKDRDLVKDRNVNGWRSSENGMCLQKDIGAGVDVIIVGAGVAGSALAYTLAKDGRRVHVIERDLTKPDRIVGELLQPGAYLRLIELGLEDCVNKIDAQQIFGYVLYKDGIRTKLPYPLENFNPDVVGVSFHHGRFIQRMRDKASSLPNVKLEQGTVTSLLEEKGTIKGVKFRRKGSQEFTAHAPLTIVCDGCCSNLRRYLCNPKVDIPSCFVGLILEDCRLPYANHAHVILGDPSLVAFYPIGSREIRCLVDVPGRQVPSLSSGEMAHYLKTKVAPQVPPELYTPFLVAIDKGNIKTMPARSMPATPHRTPGALLMGDAVNMRHPITGGGMVVALSDVVVLRNLLRPLRNLNDVPALVKDLESFYTLRKPAAFTINTLAGAAYKVLCASPDPARKELRQACFDYFCLGRVFSNGALATFSGLNYCPWSLVLHFFVVGIYAVGRLLIPFPSPKRIWIAARLILEALRIMLPIINTEGVRQMFFPARRFPPV